MKKLRACLVVLAAFVLTAALSVSAYAAKADEKHQEIAKRIADEYNKAHPTEPVETVKTMSWIAKLKSKVKVTTEENGDVVKLKAGKKVTVIQRDYHAILPLRNRYARVRPVITVMRQSLPISTGSSSRVLQNI